MGKRPNMRDIAGEDHKPEPRGNPGVVTEVAYLQSPVINSVKPKPKPSKEAGSNTYAKDNQAAIKKLKA
jgi:hypothetical protein